MLSQKDLERLAELARLELAPAENAKLLADLEEVINYFKELQGVATENVEPMTGGTTLQNVWREDDAAEKGLNKDGAVAQFPEQNKGFLQIPPVFE